MNAGFLIPRLGVCDTQIIVEKMLPFSICSSSTEYPPSPPPGKTKLFLGGNILEGHLLPPAPLKIRLWILSKFSVQF